MTKNIISFPEEYKVDEIGQQAVDQTLLAHKQFVQEVLAQLSWDITYKKLRG